MPSKFDKHKYNQYTIDDLEEVEKRWLDVRVRYSLNSDGVGLEDICNWLSDYSKQVPTTKEYLLDFLDKLLGISYEIPQISVPLCYEDTVAAYGESTGDLTFTPLQAYNTIMERVEDWFAINVHPDNEDLQQEFFSYLYHEELTERTLFCVDAAITSVSDVRNVWNDFVTYCQILESGDDDNDSITVNTSSPFSITSMDYEAPETVEEKVVELKKQDTNWIVPDDKTLEQFVERAKHELTKQDIDDVLAVIDQSYIYIDLLPFSSLHIESYEDFIRLSDDIKNGRERFIRDCEERLNRQRRSVHDAIDRINSQYDPEKYLNDLLYQKYGSMCVDAVYLLRYLEDNIDDYVFDLNLDLYGETIYSVIIQLENDVPWITEVIQDLTTRWNTAPEILSCVNQYLLSQGVKQEDLADARKQLISYLPDVEREANTPEGYKLFRACMFASRGDNINSSAAIDELDRSAQFTYGDTFIRCTDKVVPPEAAEAVASAVVNKKTNIAGKVGGLFGKVYKIPYDIHKSFSDSFDAALGEDAEEFHQYRAKKEEARQRKKQLKEQGKYDAEIERRRQQMLDRDVDLRKHSTNSRYGQKGYKDTRSNSYISAKGMNIAPNIPTWMFICAILLVIGLITWAIIRGALGLMSLGGILVGCYAVYLFHKNSEDKVRVALIAAGLYFLGVLIGGCL